MSQTALRLRCQKIYEKRGADGVYDYANVHPKLIPQWRWCDPCDAFTPVMFTEENVAECLCCGSNIDMRSRVQLVFWQDVRRDMKYPIDDNNEGYIHGLYLLEDQCDEVLEAQWFKEESERAKFIEENNLKIAYE
jgi:hypothetical protein